jgi:hypothetical protein
LLKLLLALCAVAQTKKTYPKKTQRIKANRPVNDWKEGDVMEYAIIEDPKGTGVFVGIILGEEYGGV